MCSQIITLSKNCDGQLSYCKICNIYQLVFNNIYIEFFEKEIESFKIFLESIEVKYWETKYDSMVIKRKIPINTLQKNLSLMFNRQELESLKRLISQNTKKPFNILSIVDIDYTCHLN